MNRLIAVLLCLLFCVPVPASGEKPGRAGRESRTIIEEAVTFRGRYGSEADEQVRMLLQELETADPGAALRWRYILDLWKSVLSDPDIHENVLPDGLPDTDELCIVALGYQLKPDGAMRDELISRLEVVLRCAEKYPNALIACTGGPTAAGNDLATEAVRMADWLEEHGVSRERLIVEDRSLTTAQNAINTVRILTGKYPQVRQLAIVSSDYHIATGVLLFEAEAILRAEKTDPESRLHVVSNAACKVPSGSLSRMFQAGALIELSGDYYTACEIYFETYDIPELPAARTDGG